MTVDNKRCSGDLCDYKCVNVATNEGKCLNGYCHKRTHHHCSWDCDENKKWCSDHSPCFCRPCTCCEVEDLIKSVDPTTVKPPTKCSNRDCLGFPYLKCGNKGKKRKTVLKPKAKKIDK